MTLERKSALLHSRLVSLGSVMIAYSGGTDSAFLTFAAHLALGDKMLAVIADSPSLPRVELADALAFTARHGIPTSILQTDELEWQEYRRNDATRCFHCKNTLFTAMDRERGQRGFAHLAFGMNVDDQGEFRPGQQAATQHHVVAPLLEAELTKAEIRQLAREAGLSLWDKPASACLASRIEYGREVTQKNLSQVEQAEAALHALGFPQVRVRHHGDSARIEIAREDMPRALDIDVFDRMHIALKALGFLYVSLDLRGYRSGSMNDALTTITL